MFGLAPVMTVCVSLLFFTPGHAQTAVSPPGAASCAGCHAARPGVETPVPRIAGRPTAEIEAMLARYRSDKSGSVMSRIAKGFSPDESAAIAAWYAARKD